MFIAQEGLLSNTYKQVYKNDNLNFIEWGIVLKTKYEKSTVDIQTSMEIILMDVPVMSSKLFENLDVNDSNAGSANIDLPQKGSRVLIAFINGELANPVVLGCMYDIRKYKDTTGSIEEGRRFELHQSHQWEKTDKDGNYEMYLPDGSTISVSDKVITDVDKLSEEDKFKPDSELAAKTIRIKHKTGTTVSIQANGTVDIHLASGVDLNLGSKNSGDLESAVLGETLMNLFNSHIHPTGVGPSAIPTVPMTVNDLSQNVKVKK